MSEHAPEHRKFLLDIPESITCTSDGHRIIEGTDYPSPGLTDDEAKEMLAAGHGTDPDSIKIKQVGDRGRRLSVEFRK